MKTFYIHKLGCPKNDVDAEYIAGFLKTQNLTQVIDPDKADILIVNSCGFIQPAKEESIEAILELAKLKKNSKQRKLVLTGCLAQRYASELAKEIPELDGIFGIDSFTEMNRLINKSPNKIVSCDNALAVYREYDFNRFVEPETVFAYIKVSDGCDNRCSYCAIPDIRGPFRSRPMEVIVKEAQFLLESGKKELILVSQENTAYGRDLYGENKLRELLDALSALDGDFWIRLMYLHPARLREELIDYMIDNKRICNYFDLPLQHINDSLLRSMGRQTDRKTIERLLTYIKSHSEPVAIRTNFILGYPGETKAMFDELCEFVREQEFDRLGAFVFSPEEGTKAATLPNQIDELTREKRYHTIMEIQRDIAFDKNEETVGSVVEAVVETVDIENGSASARSRFDAPEIDQLITLDTANVKKGDIISISISGYDGYDLLGTKEEL